MQIRMDCGRVSKGADHHFDTGPVTDRVVNDPSISLHGTGFLRRELSGDNERHGD
jgi:hypothetical protein